MADDAVKNQLLKLFGYKGWFMEKKSLQEFLEQLKRWEEEHSFDDHGRMIVGLRGVEPQFPAEPSIEVESERHSNFA